MLSSYSQGVIHGPQNTKTQYPERYYCSFSLHRRALCRSPGSVSVELYSGEGSIRMLLLPPPVRGCVRVQHTRYPAPISPLQLPHPVVYPSPSLCLDLVPLCHPPPDHPQCQVPCHPGCPNPGEAADSKRVGCRGEALGSDDGGGTAEIHSTAGGAGPEEEGGKNPVKRRFWHLPPVISMGL